MSGHGLRLPCIPSHICPSILQSSLHTGWTAEVWLFRGPVTPEQATSMWVAAKCCLRQWSSWNWLGPYQSCGICGFHSRCGFSFFWNLGLSIWGWPPVASACFRTSKATPYMFDLPVSSLQVLSDAYVTNSFVQSFDNSTQLTPHWTTAFFGSHFFLGQL